MQSDQSSDRYPWAALALSFLASGVGHMYSGRIVQGLFLYGARFLLPLLCIIAAVMGPSGGTLFFLILAPAAALIAIYFYAPIDAYAIAKRAGSNYELKDYNRSSLYWLLIAMQLAYPVGLTWAAREYVYEAFHIPSASMSPNLLAGDRVLVNKRPLNDRFPNRGDVVVFRTAPPLPQRNWVQRVIGVAGDRIVIKGREIEVNGKKLERERVPVESVAKIRNQVDGNVHYESQAGQRYRVLFAEEPLDETASKEIDITVPPRSLFVLGDNRDRSRDSRHIGPILVDDVIGYIDYVYFPAETWSRFGTFRD